MQGKAGPSPKTVELYQYLLARLILPTLGDLQLKAITPMRVRTWRADLLRAGRPGESTIAKSYRLLSSILATAVIHNLIARNPFVKKGAGAEHSPEMRAATPAEGARLAEVIGPPYRALVLTAAHAGCRWGELGGLWRSNLDLEADTVAVVEQAIELKTGQRIVRTPKTAAGRASCTSQPAWSTRCGSTACATSTPDRRGVNGAATRCRCPIPREALE